VAAAVDDQQSREDHARFREATDHYIRAYAENAGYDLEAARASYSRWDRDTALVGQAEIRNGNAESLDRRAAAMDHERSLHR
jgi:hypothetical protein